MVLDQLKKEKYIVILFVFLTLIVTAPLYENISNWGVHEFPPHIISSAVSKESIVQYSEFPFFNKYVCGGVPLFSNPQSRIFSPFFVLHLLLDVYVAIKLEIAIHLLIGLLGMYALGRFFRFSVSAFFSYYHQHQR
ncbi:MAG: hypothetical protein ACQETI_13325, partial [Halobacteriota archaeon]